MDKFNWFLNKCKEQRLRITPQRTVIYKLLMNSKEHPSANVIHKKVKVEFPSISLDTVCRTLATFVEIGVVDSVEGHGDPKRVDPNLENHHHFHCIGCGEITDFHNVIFDESELPDDIKNKFSIRTKRIVLSGYCEICDGHQKEASSGS